VLAPQPAALPALLQFTVSQVWFAYDALRRASLLQRLDAIEDAATARALCGTEDSAKTAQERIAWLRDSLAALLPGPEAPYTTGATPTPEKSR
jgi:hypothetical protein